MKHNRLMALAAALFAAGAVCLAQTKQEQVIEDGGTGPWKSVAVEDASLPTHTIYRPKDLKGYVDENGKIPVLLYANGACANNNLEMSRLLSEVASWGYIVLAIGPYQDMPDDAFYSGRHGQRRTPDSLHGGGAGGPGRGAGSGAEGRGSCCEEE